MTGALLLLTVVALLWCAWPRSGKPPAREWPTAEATEDAPSTPSNRADRRRVPSRSRPALHRRAHSTASWRARSGAPAARLTTKGTRPTRGRRLKNGKLPRRYRPRPAGVHYLRSPRRAPIRLPPGTHYAWCACGQLKTGTPDELDRWWVRHCSRFDLSTLQAGVDALRGRSPRRERWAHTSRELSVLAHAWLLLREPVRWHPVSGVRSSVGAARRAVLLAVDVVPAAVTAPGERTTTVPVLGDDEHWTAERRTMHRAWRDGRWGWYDTVRDRWYPGIAFAGAATITASATGGNWSAGGSWVGGVPPTSVDDARLAATSGGINVDLTTNACRSIDCTGYTATMIWGTGQILSVGDASGGAAKFVSTMTTFDGGSGASIKFVSTSNNGGTGWAITSGTKALPTPTFDGVGGKWVLQDTFSAAATTITVTNGAFFGNGKTITAGVMALSNSNTRTVDITSCPITLSAAGGWSSTNSTGLTFVSTGSTITFTSAAAAPTLGTLSYGSVVFSGFTNTGTFTGAAAFVNLTLTGAASKTSTFQLQSSITVTGTLTTNSNAAVNRLLVFSSTRGTQRTITGTGATVVVDNTAAVTGSSVDFMDVTITGSPTWSVLHSTLVGDCGGNGGAITTNATAPATQTHTSSAGGSWSDATKWTSRVPLPQDPIVVNVNTTGTLTSDMPRLGASIDFTGFNGTWTNSVVNESYGNLTLSTTTTLSGSNVLTLAGRGSQTLTNNGRSFTQGVTFSGPSGTYTLADAMISGGTVTHSDGTLDTASNTVTWATFATASGRTRSLTLGTSAVGLTATGGVTVWNAAAAGLTLSAASSTITFSNASASVRTFAGAGLTYGSLTYTVAGSTGALLISGSNTWGGAWNMSDATNARLISVTAGTTQTFTSTSTFFNVTGSSGKLTTFSSTSVGNPFTLTKTSGSAVFVDFVSLKDSAATGGLWVDGPNYTNVSGNSGWVFADNILTGADTGSGTDAAVSVAFTGDDTGSSSDAAALAAAIPGPETGTGVDTGVLSASLTATDAGSGDDEATATAALTGADIGAGADSGAVTATATGTDTGTGADASVMAASATGADTAQGADAATLAATLTGTELGAGTETGIAGVEVSEDEIGAGVESGTVAASAGGADTGTGVDVGAVTAAVSASEVGSGADADAVTVMVPGPEAGAGADAGAINLDLFGSEVAVAVEFASLVANLTGAETGVGVDFGQGGVLIVGSDTGTGVDGSSVRLAVLLLEVGEIVRRWSAGPLQPSQWGTRGIVGRITAGP